MGHGDGRRQSSAKPEHTGLRAASPVQAAPRHGAGARRTDFVKSQNAFCSWLKDSSVRPGSVRCSAPPHTKRLPPTPTQHPRCQPLAKKLGYFPAENSEPIFIPRRRWLKPQSVWCHLSPASTPAAATHPSRPVDQVVEFGDDILALARGDVGFSLDNC